MHLIHQTIKIYHLPIRLTYQQFINQYEVLLPANQYEYSQQLKNVHKQGQYFYNHLLSNQQLFYKTEYDIHDIKQEIQLATDYIFLSIKLKYAFDTVLLLQQQQQQQQQDDEQDEKQGKLLNTQQQVMTNSFISFYYALYNCQNLHDVSVLLSQFNIIEFYQYLSYNKDQAYPIAKECISSLKKQDFIQILTNYKGIYLDYEQYIESRIINLDYLSNKQYICQLSDNLVSSYTSKHVHQKQSKTNFYYLTKLATENNLNDLYKVILNLQHNFIEKDEIFLKLIHLILKKKRREKKRNVTFMENILYYT